MRPGDSNFNVKMNCASTFWKLKSPEIPHFSKLAKYCFTITTLSAAAERVFSRLKSALSLLQVNQTLKATSEVAVMYQYNHKIPLSGRDVDAEYNLDNPENDSDSEGDSSGGDDSDAISERNGWRRRWQLRWCKRCG